MNLLVEGVPFEPGEVLLPDGTRRVYERWTSWDIPSSNWTLIANIISDIL